MTCRNGAPDTPRGCGGGRHFLRRPLPLCPTNQDLVCWFKSSHPLLTQASAQLYSFSGFGADAPKFPLPPQLVCCFDHDNMPPRVPKRSQAHCSNTAAARFRQTSAVPGTNARKMQGHRKCKFSGTRPAAEQARQGENRNPSMAQALRVLIHTEVLSHGSRIPIMDLSTCCGVHVLQLPGNKSSATPVMSGDCRPMHTPHCPF